jgi:hypothetical protein
MGRIWILIWIDIEMESRIPIRNRIGIDIEMESRIRMLIGTADPQH